MRFWAIFWIRIELFEGNSFSKMVPLPSNNAQLKKETRGNFLTTKDLDQALNSTSGVFSDKMTSPRDLVMVANTLTGRKNYEERTECKDENLKKRFCVYVSQWLTVGCAGYVICPETSEWQIT